MPVDLNALVPTPAAAPRTIDVSTLVAEVGMRPQAWQSAAPANPYRGRGRASGSGGPVRESPDLTRILALPRRPIPEDGTAGAAALIAWARNTFGRVNQHCTCAKKKKDCILQPKRAQAWALHEIATAGGVLGQIVIGGGKCLDASAEFFDYLTGRRRSVAELGAVEVATLDGGLRGAPAEAFPSGRKECVEVLLRDGSKLVASYDHPVLTQRGWVEAGWLRGSDFVAVAAAVPEPARATQATDDEVALVAYLLSDGGCSHSSLRFTNATPAVIEDFQRCATAVCSGWSEERPRSKARQFTLLGAQPVRKRLDGEVKGHHKGQQNGFRDRWGLYGLAKNKRAHASIWGLPRDQVVLFINRFWACDGHVSKRGIELTLASERLLDDVRYLLLRLGIRTRKHHTPKRLNGALFPAWRLSARGAAAARFLEQVGDVLGKEPACQWLRGQLASTERNTNYDAVPIGLRQLSEICDELGMPGRGEYSRSATARYRPRSAARSFLQPGSKHVSREKFTKFCEQWNYTGRYAHFANPDIAWEPVASVFDAGVREVFDLSVPGTHNFVANGMIVHNTGLGLLAPLAMPGCRLAVLLVPPGLRGQLIREYELWAQHWRVPSIVVHGKGYSAVSPGAPVLHVYPYSLLSRPSATDWLEKLRPDTIFADEVHRLRHPDGAGTSRVLRYFAEHPDTRFGGWTGSITETSPKDYAHLALLALRGGSPVPLDANVVADWARVLDPSADFSVNDPGALLAMCEEGEHIYSGFRRRLTETRGIVATTESAIGADLEIVERQAPPVPPDLQAMMDRLKPDGDWVRPDGEQLADPLEVTKTARELACGLYLKWIYPRGEPVELRDDWFEKRKAWHRELRSKLKARAEHLDSPKLCELAAMRAHGQLMNPDELPEWEAEYWLPWHEIRDKVKPSTIPVRVDDFLARDAARWALENRGIVWYSTVAFGEWVAEISGLPLHGGGPGAEERILAEDGSRSIIVSIDSHGTGRDGLQALFHKQLITSPPCNATEFDQVLGRLFRLGQAAEKIWAWYYAHTDLLRANLETALARAQYAFGTWGSSHKLHSFLDLPWRNS